MIGQSVSHYRILEKIGEGGMGVVYKAEDIKLKRTVALKFLPPDLTRDPEAKERFIREARAASALDHPNICTIHEIDETKSGQMFIAMACYSGETLRETIDSGTLAMNEALDIAIQVAQGLQEAHENGIVHRDIKPANIIITSKRQAKIMDFGLVKLGHGAQLTREGLTPGTVAYMSPEQSQGREVDQRTDLWSLGVVLYEMVTGQRPFKGDYDQAVVYSILNEEAEPISAIRQGAPAELEKLVSGLLAKNPSSRLRSAQELLTELKGARDKLRTLSSLPAASEAKAQPSIAVMPFVDMSPEKDQEYFCDGMAEEIINALTQLYNLRVIARTSAFAFKGKSKDIREIGKKLDVATC